MIHPNPRKLFPEGGYYWIQYASTFPEKPPIRKIIQIYEVKPFTELDTHGQFAMIEVKAGLYVLEYEWSLKSINSYFSGYNNLYVEKVQPPSDASGHIS